MITKATLSFTIPSERSESRDLPLSLWEKG